MTSYQANAPVPNNLYGVANGTNSNVGFITVFNDRDPTVNDINYVVKTRWINTLLVNEWILLGFTIINGLTSANWIELTAGAGILTLSDDANTVVKPSSDSSTPPDNIQLTGELQEQAGGPFKTVVAYPNSYQININPMSPARWIVDPIGLSISGHIKNGTHTTIGSALASASPGDTIIIMPGNPYTENLNLVPGINLTAFTGDANTPNVTISGLCQLAAAGTVTISNINLQTNGNYCVAVTGSTASNINLVNCNITGVENACILNNSTSPNSSIKLFSCTGDQQQNGHSLYGNLGSGSIEFMNCFFTNSGLSTSPATASSGVVNATYSQFLQPILFSGTGAGTFEHCLIDCTASNSTCLTSTTSGLQSYKWTRFSSGSASSISISGSISMEYCTVASSNTNAITGTGTLRYGIINFNSSSSTINATLTQSYQTTTIGNIQANQITFGSGTALNTYVKGTWTPNLQINVSSTGITYTSQLGGYIRVGDMVNFWVFIQLSSKGSNTGAVTISNFPFTTSTNGPNQAVAVGEFANVSIAGYTSVGLQFNNTSTQGNFVVSATTGTAALMLDTNITNTTIFKFSGSYIID